MTLKDWLAEHEMSDAEFARISGIGQRALVQKYRHGRQFPGLENLRRIRKATGGRVTANDFFTPTDDTPPSPEPVEAAE